jgi:hypothetical protein
MNAARFAAEWTTKSATVADLKLSPTALYLLGDLDDDDAVFTPEMVKAILAEAKNTWVDEDRCWEIAEPPSDKSPGEAEKPPAPEEQEKPSGSAEPEPAEPTPDDQPSGDKTPPLLPPPPEPSGSTPSRRDEALREVLHSAIEKLKPLLTKKVEKFTQVVSQNDLIKTVDFLNAVAKRNPLDDTQTATIQKLTAEIAAQRELQIRYLGLQSENEELRARVAKLEAKLAELEAASTITHDT